jgi:zinc protease
VKTKLATDLTVRHEMKIDPSLLIADVTLAGGASLDRVQEVLDAEVARLKKAPPTKAELERARGQLRAWHQYEQDGVTFQGMLLSASEALATWDAWDAALMRIAKVRPEKIQEAARRYLVDEHRSVVRFHAQEVAP